MRTYYSHNISISTVPPLTGSQAVGGNVLIINDIALNIVDHFRLWSRVGQQADFLRPYPNHKSNIIITL